MAKRGDVAARRRLVGRPPRRAFAVAVALVRNDDDAREIVQEAFLRAFKALPRFQSKSTFFTWLYRIVTNLSIDRACRTSGHALSEAEELGQALRGGTLFSKSRCGLRKSAIAAISRRRRPVW